ncbi:hypothetical protein K1719_023011 [Acacia pycnantha]|nr:hypothetical protein K1719_023011 [Acacia pycnantha]
MRPVQEMNVEFVNALNAAESECDKLRRMLEEEQKLVQRLEQEKEDEVQMANRKIERMSQQLAEARKDVEFATVRADVAEDEWIKVKRELQEAQVFVQLLKLENEETRQSTLKQVEEKELEVANALNAAAIAESECDKLRTMLEKGQKLVQRHKLEKDDEAQLDKRRIEEISRELVEVQKNAKYETTRADLAEIEWIKVKKELQEKLGHVQSLKQECQETRQTAMRQVEEKELEFADAINAAAAAASSSAAAEGECAKVKRMLIEEGKTVQRLILEKDLVAKLAQRQIEETRQELANVLKATTITESSSTAEVFI